MRDNTVQHLSYDLYPVSQYRIRGLVENKGKTIFHGLSNFVAALGEGEPAMRRGQPSGPGQSMRHRELYDFEPDPRTNFHPEAKHTIIAKCTIDGGKISRVSYLPCSLYGLQLLKNDEKGQEVFEYMDKITRAEGLNARYEWEGDEVVIHASGTSALTPPRPLIAGPWRNTL